jgi:hypothetical protein
LSTMWAPASVHFQAPLWLLNFSCEQATVEDTTSEHHFCTWRISSMGFGCSIVMWVTVVCTTNCFALKQNQTNC